jgi:hypothetical protein
MNGNPMGTWTLVLDSKLDVADDVPAPGQGQPGAGDIEEPADIAPAGNDPEDPGGTKDGADTGNGAGENSGIQLPEDSAGTPAGGTENIASHPEGGSGDAGSGSGANMAISAGRVSGLWQDANGHCVRIEQDGEKLTTQALENKGPVGWKTAKGTIQDRRLSVLFGGRVEIGELLPGNAQIRWSNSSVWSLFNASPSAADIDVHSFHPFNLAGLWISENGHEIRMTQNESKWLATALENKGPIGWKTANGTLSYWAVNFLFGNRVYQGKVSDDGKRIFWGPGLFWTRSLATGSGDAPDDSATIESAPAPDNPKPKWVIIGFGSK